MKVFDTVLFMKQEWTIIEIDHERNMYKLIGNGNVTWVKESDINNSH